MLSPLIKWDHSASYSVPKVKPEYFGKIVTVNISHEKHEFLKGHDIDGRILMPAAAYLVNFQIKNYYLIVLDVQKFRRKCIETSVF